MATAVEDLDGQGLNREAHGFARLAHERPRDSSVSKRSATGHRVDSAEMLPGLLEQCLNAKGVQLIDCPVDYSENDRILNKDIKELSKALQSGGPAGLAFETSEAAEPAPVSANPTPA